jgi:hypothetical protein
MVNVRALFALGLAVSVAGGSQAATLVDSDFTKGESKGWVLNGDAVKIVDVSGDSARPKALQLTSDEGSQTSVAWTEMKFTVPSFSYTTEMQIRHDESLGCPADGLAMSFANVDDTSTVGGGGGALGLFGGAIEQFSALEINLWYNQGLGDSAPNEGDRSGCTFGKHITFAFDVINANLEDIGRNEGSPPGDPAKGGAKIGQVAPPTGMTIVNGGWYRIQWNVAEDGTMTAYVTGLSDSNKQFQKVKVAEAKINPDLKPIGFEGRFGLHSATGGAFSTVEVARVRVDSPVLPEPL